MLPIFAFMQLLLEIFSGIANSIDPDQTAQEQSDLGLQCLHIAILSESLVYKILGHLL